MARALKKISWKQIAVITAIGFAWTKLGVGTAVTEIMPGSVTGVVPLKPGGTCPAGWVKVGNQCVRL
jgi:hypothetical protein